MPPDQKKIEKLNGDIEQLKKLCKELTSAGDDQVCTKEMRKKCASGQHGLKDNATNKQVRLGLQERIDQLKRDVVKEQSKK